VTGDPRERVGAIRQAVQSVDPKIPVYDVMTMDERLAQVTQRPRFYTLAVAMFGGCALLLAVVGLYGLMSHSVTQRRRDIGIRMGARHDSLCIAVGYAAGGFNFGRGGNGAGNNCDLARGAVASSSW